jgi:unsaturated rhamnogalacturonyl hydrolase
MLNFFRCCLKIIVLCLLVFFPSLAQKKESEIYSKPYIFNKMKQVCSWQLAHPVKGNDSNENDWARAAFYPGVMATYKATNDPKYLNAAINWSESNYWKLAKRFRHADDHARGQTYLEIFEVKKKPYMIKDVVQTFDSLILLPKPGREDWWWCDALFMAPPVLSKLAYFTGEKKYLDYLDKMFWDTYDFLYDKEENLFFRDSKFFEKKTPNGKKTFWARGNGWVMAGTVRVLEYLPKSNSSYNKYVDLYKKMALSIKKVQQADGLWRPSLLDPAEVAQGESSSSSFFCYSLAWGINNKILDKKEYLPVVRKAWEGLQRNINSEGRLGWVQQIGLAPEKFEENNYQEYGTGAFLLAASEMSKLQN